MDQRMRTSAASEVQLFKALADETRLKTVALLSTGELCVCDIMEILGLPQSTCSRHLAYLKNSGLIMGRREGKWMHYRLNPELLESRIHNALIDHISGLQDLQALQRQLAAYLADKKDSRRCS